MSLQFCMVPRIAARNLARLSSRSPKAAQRSARPPPMVFTSSTRRSARGSTASYLRLIANVGRTGSSASKRWTGKLLQMPPSENQQRAGLGLGRGGSSIGSQGRLRIARQRFGWSRCQLRQALRASLLTRRRQSRLQSGTALSSSGKLRLMRAATTIGSRSARGSGNRGCMKRLTRQSASLGSGPAIQARASRTR